MQTGFDSQLYMEKQKARILERIERSKGKLYLEFGGKLFDDYHAARVLPGFDVNAKARLLCQLGDMSEIILCISAPDIESNKVREDLGITYDLDLLRLIDNLRAIGLFVSSIVITQFDGQPAAEIFRKKLEMRGERAYVHRLTQGYPTNVSMIVSEQGYGSNSYIETEKPLVVVTAPGPRSGKLATCLSQIYHECRRGMQAGYAKFETFPIWNLSLKHPVNMAYEAATADLDDINMIDPFHLDAYGETTVNYNRDIEIFPVVQAILERATGMGSVYRSPTDMGVNMAGMCITNEEVVSTAAKQEIIRRLYSARRDYKLGRVEPASVKKIEIIMSQLGLVAEDRPVVLPALQKAQEKGTPAAAIMLEDGQIVTGRETQVTSACASAVMNAIKYLAGLPDDILLISPVVLEPVTSLKEKNFGEKTLTLSLEEVLICLSICAATNHTAVHALSYLPKLQACEAHATCIVPDADEKTMRKLGVRLTCEPVFRSKDLYYE